MHGFQSINSKNVNNILGYLEVQDNLELIKSNSFFTKIEVLRNYQEIYKELVNEIYKSKTLVNHNNLIQHDLKHLKVLLKHHHLVYNESKCGILADIAGYIHGSVMNLINDPDTNSYNYENDKNQFHVIVKRLANPNNHTETQQSNLVLNKQQNTLLVNLFFKKHDNITSNNLESKRNNEFTNNYNTFMNTNLQGNYNFPDKGITTYSLQAILKSICFSKNVKRLIISKSSTEQFSSIKSYQNCYSYITSVHLYIKIFKELTNSHSLKLIDLSNNDLSTKHIKPLFVNLVDSVNLKTIDLCNNKISGDHMEFITSFLINNSSLNHLDLGSNILGHDGAKYIVEGLIKNSTLKKLDISYNGLCAKGGYYVGKYISEINLNSLNLEGNYLTDQGLESLSKNLEYNKTLSYLILDNNSVTEKALTNLVKGISFHEKLISLDLKNFNITDKTGECIFDVMSQYKSKINSINLNDNKISEITLISMNNFLKNHTEASIGKIDLENNLINEKCGEIIAEIIKSCTTLKNFNLKGNRIGSGVKDLVESIIDSKSLKILDLSNNNLGSYVSSISEFLSSNTTLKTLILSQNSINDEGLSKITSGLKMNTSLMHLHVDLNRISKEGYLEAIKILKNNKFTKKINYSDSLYNPRLPSTMIKEVYSKYKEHSRNSNSIRQYNSKQHNSSVEKKEKNKGLNAHERKTRGIFY